MQYLQKSLMESIKPYINPNFMKSAYLLVTCLILAGCSNVEITNEYIINTNWTKEGERDWSNSITIYKAKPKTDSVINPFSNLKQAEIVNKLEIDSSFMRYANVKIGADETYRNKRIYFNRYNGFYWGAHSRHNDKDTSQTIGALQPNTWYRFSDLGQIATSHIFVYIDSANNTHRFDVTHSNF